MRAACQRHALCGLHATMARLKLAACQRHALCGLHAKGTSYAGCMPKARLMRAACQRHVLSLLHAKGTSYAGCMPNGTSYAGCIPVACPKLCKHGAPGALGLGARGVSRQPGQGQGGRYWVLGGPHRSLTKMSLRVMIASHCAWSPRAKTRASRNSLERPRRDFCPVQEPPLVHHTPIRWS